MPATVNTPKQAFNRAEDLAYIEAEGTKLISSVDSGATYWELPGASDITIAGVTSSPNTIRTFRRTYKIASKPTPATITGSLTVMRPELTGYRNFATSLKEGQKATYRVVLGDDADNSNEFPEAATVGERSVAINETTGLFTFAGSLGAPGNEALDLGRYVKIGSAYYLIDYQDAAGNRYTDPALVSAAVAPAVYSIVDPELISDAIVGHVSSQDISLPGSTDGGVMNGSFTVEAETATVLEWVPNV